MSLLTQDSISFTAYLMYFGVLVFIFVLYMKFCKRPAKLEVSSESEDEDAIEQREFTVAELKKYDGENNEAHKVYISAKGRGETSRLLIILVYDVTTSGFYTKGGPYHVFAGHDATVCLSKNSFDINLLNKMDVSKMNMTEKDTLYGYMQQFEMKYNKVGWCKEWRDVNGKDSEDEEEDEGDNKFSHGELESTVDHDEKKKQ
jgi:predicted heme/steroid binding protein